ncbi:cathepsin l1-like, partial [Lynx pardinus]
FSNMHPAFFLATFCLGIVSAAPQVNQSLDEQWSQWKATQGKLYSMTSEEFKQVLNDLKIQKHKKGKVFQAPLFAKIPSSVDWREKGYVTSVKDQNKSCKYKPENSVANVTAFWSVVNKEDGLMTTVATVGPVSAAVDASLNSFQFYKKGIYYDPKCSNKHLNHGVLVVGYGFEGEESDNKKYWTVNNSL